MAGKANLTYYISERILTGTVDGKLVNIMAVSGGGAGTTNRHGPDEPSAVNNPLLTGQSKSATHRGGPLPAGVYTIEPPAFHGHKRLQAYLYPADPHFTAHTHRLGGHNFHIHAQGHLGSDGCIVPLHLGEFDALMQGLLSDHGGRLTVVEHYGSLKPH